MAQAVSAAQLAARIGDGLSSLQKELSPPAYGAVQDLVRSILAFYGAGLERLVTLLTECVPEGKAALRFLADDPLVSALLLVHGLHPLNVRERVELALERVRPYLRSHNGGVELAQIDDQGVVYLRLHGTCNGCPASLLTVRLAIERLIEELAPEVTAVQVEGLPQPPGDLSSPDLQAPAPGGWRPVDLAGLAPGKLKVVQVDGLSVLICRVGADVYSYVNSCPACGNTLDGAQLEGELLRCPGCTRQYQVRLAGRAQADPAYHLTPLPVIWENDGWKVAIPGR